MPGMFDDLDTDFNAAPAKIDGIGENINQHVHISQGGDKQDAPCPSCRGTGRFVAYTGRTVGRCFKCKGTGKVSNRVAGAAKAKATREANWQTWCDDHRSEIDFIRNEAERGSRFYTSLLSQLVNDQRKLTDNQLVAVHRGIVEKTARIEAAKAKREQDAPTVNVDAIKALFDVAVDNDIKRPVFRAAGLEISKAPLTGANPGALYVKSDSDEYLGKIFNSKFHASRSATPETVTTLNLIAADPTAEAIKYARKTGRCSCCGHSLVDPVSIRAGIGPICAENWGLDYRRELARDELREEGETK